MACRNPEKAEEAAGAIQADIGQAALDPISLDLADLASIRSFCQEFTRRYDQLDILCNNGGVMWTPFRQTDDGFELQFGVNHLGHFALTGLLLETLLNSGPSRVVNVSSLLHITGRIDFTNLNAEQSYQMGAAYSQSKLAQLLFTYELQRKLEKTGYQTISLACHPGYAATNLPISGARMAGATLREKILGIGNRLIAQTPQMGALPALLAATAPQARGGDYIIPGGLFQLRGHQKKGRSSSTSYNRQIAERLWARSEALTGVSFAILKDKSKPERDDIT
jgi:NAD(P)-dependent dehydrogenase (short-subunit alcohol dehydrogenase family)